MELKKKHHRSNKKVLQSSNGYTCFFTAIIKECPGQLFFYFCFFHKQLSFEPSDLPFCTLIANETYSHPLSTFLTSFATTMSRPQRRMIPLPSAQELTQGPNAIRLQKKKDRFLFMTYNVKTRMNFSQLMGYVCMIILFLFQLPTNSSTIHI